MPALLSPLHRDQLQIRSRADASADAVERLIHEVWGKLLAVIERGGAWLHVYHSATNILNGLHALTHHVGADLADAAKFARNATAEVIDQHLPARFEDEWTRDVPLFEPPDLDTIARIIFASDWRERLSAATKLAAPEALASIIATGTAQGKTPKQIASEIAPAVQNVQSTARRIARTESIRVAHEIQLDTYESLGTDVVIGYQIHSMHSPYSRSWHVKRDGTIYYREPAAGQKGFYQMPHPPMEPEDPDERPPGTPQIAWNCLCWLTPVLAR